MTMDSPVSILDIATTRRRIGSRYLIVIGSRNDDMEERGYAVLSKKQDLVSKCCVERMGWRHRVEKRFELHTCNLVMQETRH